MRCICGGVYDFVKAYENGKIPDDIYQHQCMCGVVLHVKDGMVWDWCHPLTTKSNQEENVDNEYYRRNFMNKPIGIKITCDILMCDDDDMEQHFLYDKMIKIQRDINELVSEYGLNVVSGTGEFLYNKK